MSAPPLREFPRRRDGVVHALRGGLWLHRWRLDGKPMAHLVSSDREALLVWGAANGMDARWLQFKPLKDPATGQRVPCWHWDLFEGQIPLRP